MRVCAHPQADDNKERNGEMNDAREIEMSILGRIHRRLIQIQNRITNEDRAMPGLTEAQALKLDGTWNGVGLADVIIQEFAEKAFGSSGFIDHPAWQGETLI